MRGTHLLAASLATLALAGCTAMAQQPDSRPVPKAYVVAEITVTDLDAYREYVQAAFPVIQSFGGQFLTRGGTTIAVEGPPPGERVMIIEFESLERAKEFEYSQAYTDIAPLRKASAQSRLFIVEGSVVPGSDQP